MRGKIFKKVNVINKINANKAEILYQKRKKEKKEKEKECKLGP